MSTRPAAGAAGQRGARMELRATQAAECLSRGTDALRRSRLEEAQAAFQAALHLLRPPDLLVGEGQAYRGLAEVAALQGDWRLAEAEARRAVASFQAAVAGLGALDGREAAPEVLYEARVGEGQAWLLLAGCSERAGDPAEEGAARARAEALLGEQPPVEVAAVLALSRARVALNRQDLAEARRQVEAAPDARGPVAIGLLRVRAELARLEGEVASAERWLDEASAQAHEAELPGEAARVALARAELHAGQPLEIDQLEVALTLARAAQERTLVGRVALELGDRQITQGGSEELLVEGLQHLAATRHRVALERGLLLFGLAQVRRGRPVLALLAGDLLRRRALAQGVSELEGQAWRLLVKALAGLRLPGPTLAAAWHRADRFGDLQPNAHEVLAHYRERAPADWVEGLVARGAEERERGALAVVERTLAQVGGWAARDPWEQLDELLSRWTSMHTDLGEEG